MAQKSQKQTLEQQIKQLSKELVEEFKHWQYLREIGYDPFVMIYDKYNAPVKTRHLQRWCNNKIIFNSEPDFANYNPKRGVRP